MLNRGLDNISDEEKKTNEFVDNLVTLSKSKIDDQEKTNKWQEEAQKFVAMEKKMTERSAIEAEDIATSLSKKYNRPFDLNELLLYVDYKKGMIQVDGKDYARIEVKKQNFGLTKSFEVFSLSGKKIIIAVVATEFEQEKNDNSYLPYRFTFLTANQVGIFKISSLSQEKSFAKLIGNSGILVNDSTDDNKVKEFIASKSITPRIAIDYTTVSRTKSIWPVELHADKTITQSNTIIGTFKPTGQNNGADQYDFMFPSGIIIAKVSFTGGNNVQNFEVFTLKDNLRRVVPIPTKETIKWGDASIDKNQFGLQRITKWLVDNNYL